MRELRGRVCRGGGPNQQVPVRWAVMWVPSSEAATMTLVGPSRQASRLEEEVNWWAVAGTAAAVRLGRLSVLVVGLMVATVVMVPVGQATASIRQVAGLVPRLASRRGIAVAASAGGGGGGGGRGYVGAESRSGGCAEHASP